MKLNKILFSEILKQKGKSQFEEVKGDLELTYHFRLGKEIISVTYDETTKSLDLGMFYFKNKKKQLVKLELSNNQYNELLVMMQEELREERMIYA